VADLIRVGSTIINMDNVLQVDLECFLPEHEGEPHVVFEFNMRGFDELVEEGTVVAEPYMWVFEGKAAEAVRRHLKEKCPDLLAAGFLDDSALPTNELTIHQQTHLRDLTKTHSVSGSGGMQK